MFVCMTLIAYQMNATEWQACLLASTGVVVKGQEKKKLENFPSIIKRFSERAKSKIHV